MHDPHSSNLLTLYIAYQLSAHTDKQIFPQSISPPNIYIQDGHVTGLVHKSKTCLTGFPKGEKQNVINKNFVYVVNQVNIMHWVDSADPIDSHGLKHVELHVILLHVLSLYW